MSDYELDTNNVSPRGFELIDYHTKRFFALFEPGLKYAQTEDCIKEFEQEHPEIMETLRSEVEREEVRAQALECMRGMEKTVENYAKECAEIFIQDREEPAWFGLGLEDQNDALESICILLVDDWGKSNTYPSCYAKTYVASAMVGCF